ncbi:Oxalate--CoA ligase (Oxalyl-CoA synthetase) (Peroxisomal-coenzyme A synthetase) [Durusdinium trenchii]|uniref:Oxalate--CoA ligase (Oxalyl-CoA synthetase) (Peroxisomal-coenzyme A synthetase) n=1 Tax=Durusdinium trenchii TaxID=1381693 RepID=A0ABP0KPT4_9DINO
MLKIVGLCILTCAVLAQEPSSPAAGCSALQKAATISLAAARVEDAQETSGQMTTENAHMVWLLVIFGLFAFAPQAIHPVVFWIRGWLFTFRSMGEVEGLPASQRYCQDEVKKSFKNWLDVIPKTSDPLIREIGSRSPLTFNELHAFAQDKEVWLSRFGIGLRDRVCTMIPNGPEAAVCFLVFPLRCVFAPLNPAFTVSEIEFEFQDLPCHTVVVMSGEDNSATLQVAAGQKVQVLEMQRHPKVAGLFSLQLHKQSPISLERRLPNAEKQSGRDDIALVLHTSGTTKKPKIVPLTHENLTVGALCITSTLRRQREDVCLNLMPLYHIHGLSVNVLASAMSGSSVVCTPGYKGPDQPTQWLASGAASWYSAVPTMHQGIVEAGLSFDEFSATGAGIGLIRNCSAALVPVLADKMEQLFQCVVMPTYAMSESMPIASNPLPPHLRVLRSVGQAAGPQMVLRHDNNSEPKKGEEAEICVKGTCVTKGYEMRAHMDQDPNIEAFTSDGWLRTGDKGYIDDHNYLCLSGRYKEIINRGGEKISPFEVENVCRQWPPIFDCIAFSCPHAQLGETVGLAAVLRDGEKMDSKKLEELRQFSAAKMSEKWLPQCILFMKDIPKGSTGKPARIGLAKRMKLEALDVNKSQVTSWDATSGLALPIEASSQKPIKTAVDSLGKARDANDAKMQELALLETMYGFAIIFVTFVHAFSETYEYSGGELSDYTAPFRPEQDTWQLGHLMAVNMKPVALFLLCYGYLESQHRNFVFGGFEREMFLLFILVFQELFFSLFIIFWEVLTARTAPSGYSGLAKLDLSAALSYDAIVLHNPEHQNLSWFILFIFIGRILLVLSHKIGVPGWMQILVFTAASALLPLTGQLEPRLSPGAMSTEYTLMLIGAYVAPALVKAFTAHWNSTSAFGHIIWRCLSLAYMIASVRPPIACRFSDASRSPCYETQLGMALCMPLAVVQQSLWVGAVAILLAPKVAFLEPLGRCSLGAYLFNRATFVFLRDYGVVIGGMTFLPSLTTFAKAFTGKSGAMGLTVGYLMFLLCACYATNLITGILCNSFASGAWRNAWAVARFVAKVAPISRRKV